MVAEIEPYANFKVAEAVAEVRKIQDTIRVLDRRKRVLEGVQADSVKSIERNQKVLNELPVHSKVRQKENLLRQKKAMKAAARTPRYVIKKVGALIVGKRAKSVYYDVQYGLGPHGIALRRFGNLPRITQDDYLYAVIANNRTRQHKHPFMLEVNATAAPVPDPTPIRPTPDTPGLLSGIWAALDRTPPPSIEVADAYQDIVLPFGNTFPGGHELAVTIKTYVDKKDASGSGTTPQPVTLIDKEKYPQVRTLYRYNVTTGVLVSHLRDPSFTKEPVTDNATSVTRYRIMEREGDLRVLPVIALSWHLWRVDIQEPVGWSFLQPSITLAFPAPDVEKNVFIGFSHEIIRNTQVFYGAHFGKIKQLDAGARFLEETTASQPSTSDVYQVQFAAGMTMNLNFVLQVLKKLKP